MLETITIVVCDSDTGDVRRGIHPTLRVACRLSFCPIFFLTGAAHPGSLVTQFQEGFVPLYLCSDINDPHSTRQPASLLLDQETHLLPYLPLCTLPLHLGVYITSVFLFRQHNPLFGDGVPQFLFWAYATLCTSRQPSYILPLCLLCTNRYPSLFVDKYGKCFMVCYSELTPYRRTGNI